MCYFGSSSTREPVPATLENKIKSAGSTSGATSMTDNVNLDSDIQRRRRALRLSGDTGGGVMY